MRLAGPAGVFMLRFAANLTTLFTERPFLERFDAAAHAGFDEVEFLFPYSHPPAAVASAARQAGVRVVLFNAPPGCWEAGERGLACLAGREAAFRATITTALPYLEALECPQLHVMAGLGNANCPRQSALYVDRLAWAAGCLAPHGVTVLIEALSAAAMPGYFLRSQAQALNVLARLAALGLSNTGLQFDCFHAAFATANVADLLTACLPQTRHIQIAGFPERHEPVTVSPDYPKLFQLLDNTGYAGSIGCEYHPRAGTLAGLGWMQHAKAFD